MNSQFGQRLPPTPAEIMERLENSMAEIDQMMAELRGSMKHTPMADRNSPHNPFQAHSTPMDGYAYAPQPQAPPRPSPPTYQNVNDYRMPNEHDFNGMPREYVHTIPQMRHEPEPFSAPFVHNRQERPRMVPDRFDGRTPVLDYISHFEACCEVNRWTKEEATQYLAASLRGSAVKLLAQQTGHRLTYDELIERMKRRYGTGGKADVFLAELRQRRRGPKETIQELGQCIRDLTALAYPGFDEAGQDRLARGHFLDAILDSRIREGLFRAQPKTLDEAIEAALNIEAFIKMEGGRRETRSTGYTRSAVPEKSKSNNPAYDRLEKAVDELIGQAEKRIQQMLTKKNPAPPQTQN